MKKKILQIGTAALLVMAAPVWAADIFGNWIAREHDGINWFLGETVFYFRLDGTRLTGTITDRHGETAISEGRIDGDEISFVVTRGVGENAIKLMYSGKVYLNEIKFKREIQGADGQPLEFVAKREFQRNQDIPLRQKITPVSPPPRIVVPEEPLPRK
jgi:hypothetical protein